jgi:predicted nucleic-acid-binding protein
VIAFDTNVLLRLLLNDDARQAKQAQVIVDRALSASDRVLLPDVVLCEVEWVLDSVYKLPKSKILETLQRLLDAEEFAFISRVAVAQALENYRKGKADFSDYLIGESAAVAGATTTYTFDRALRRSNGFSHPA